jgi:hypothetical protein
MFIGVMKALNRHVERAFPIEKTTIGATGNGAGMINRAVCLRRNNFFVSATEPHY